MWQRNATAIVVASFTTTAAAAGATRAGACTATLAVAEALTQLRLKQAGAVKVVDVPVGYNQCLHIKPIALNRVHDKP